MESKASVESSITTKNNAFAERRYYEEKSFSRKSAEEGAGGKSFGTEGKGFSVRKRSQDEKGISRERGRWHRHD